MRRILIVLACLCSPFCAGCAVEREYFFNHNPFTDTALFIGGMIGGFFDSEPADLSDVKYQIEWPADIHPL